MRLREIFAKNLRNARHAKGLSQEELAFKADISAVYVSTLERGVYSASIDVIEALAKPLGVTAASLLEVGVRRAQK